MLRPKNTVLALATMVNTETGKLSRRLNPRGVRYEKKERLTHDD